MSLKEKVRTKISYLYRGINLSNKCYHPRIGILKDKNDDLLAGFHSILNRWKNYFCILLSH